MKPSIELADAKQRLQALDPNQSFIVQAPAGSGKTELLVRRYLMLLACVVTPEAIIAITFTRKAANEMRLRIMQALELAVSTETPAGKEAERYYLAKKVLVQDQALAWNLLSNPNRLRILTIDSFCQSLTRQMPLLAGSGEKLTPVDHPEYLYRLAIQELLKQLEEPLPWQSSLSHLLSHCDNDFQRVENLFIPMLARREQWLDYLLLHQQHLREDLEQALFNINQTLVEKLNQLISKDLAQELKQLLNFSLEQRQLASLIHDNDLTFWQTASQLLLTESNTWRKQLRKTEGFATKNEIKDKVTLTDIQRLKKQCLDLIAQLSQQDLIKDTLIALKQAPPLHYTDTQWQILQSLFELLPVLVAHLKIIFQQQQKVDYTEILLAASAALGQAENPTDLALALDYQIQHLLVDEFQDTSSTQLHLIEKLTAGWQNQDGRSLFLVGDPMQSIYRFRKAEVGLFLQVQQCGIGTLQLQTLNLSVNFRSTAGIVAWVNQQFSQLLPHTHDLEQGTVCYSPASAYSHATQSNAVFTYWQQTNHDTASAEQAEAEQILKIIQKIKQENSQTSIAILVRARSHLRNILSALRREAIPYQAIEIDSLAEKSAVQDLLVLTRALHHFGDRIAWLALLRSPYGGLSLSDLSQFTQCSDEKKKSLTIWQQLQQFEETLLSADTKQRLRRIVPVLQQCLQQQGRVPLPSWIKQTWIALGGPTTLSNWQEMDDIHAYFNFLENKIKQEGEALDFFKLGDELSHIYTQTTSATPAHAVEVMTMHKAKGLEFDHVILPGLQRRGRSELSPLLLYSEKMLTPTKKDFLLAPIKASHEEQDLIYNYLFDAEKQKNAAELTRLLYVACTRAKQSLHLLGTFTLDEAADIKAPAPLSLLGQLWPILNIKPEEILTPASAKTTQDLTTQGLLKRLPAAWQAPIANQFDLSREIKPQAYSYHWQLHPERVLGTVIHRLLYQISQDGLQHWDSKKINDSQSMFAGLLAQNGLLASQIPEALDKLNVCLEKTLTNARGRWILSQQHQSAQSEYAITALLHGKLQNWVIDRTFIDSNTEIRWIIDYKTTDYQGNKPEEFLSDAMQQHQQQLNNYAEALFDKQQTIRCGLYFPLTSLWCEWEFSEISTTVTVMASECNERGHP
ncbi:UvrD-helicase domain-containing protein [Rickettsiella endosymbiont of Aleochara curtula]|uniref:UvrD-helicase domain-containing protein n=1 Tax=Rickettsiella endosymbiont of Aleochara curtula TaxID=3077936 RepID=UPI00313EF8A2